MICRLGYFEKIVGWVEAIAETQQKLAKKGFALLYQPTAIDAFAALWTGGRVIAGSAYATSKSTDRFSWPQNGNCGLGYKTSSSPTPHRVAYNQTEPC